MPALNHWPICQKSTLTVRPSSLDVTKRPKIEPSNQAPSTSTWKQWRPLDDNTSWNITQELPMPLLQGNKVNTVNSSNTETRAVTKMTIKKTKTQNVDSKCKNHPQAILSPLPTELELSEPDKHHDPALIVKSWQLFNLIRKYCIMWAIKDWCPAKECKEYYCAILFNI